MKNINIMLCIFGLLSILSLYAHEQCSEFETNSNSTTKRTRCYKFGIGANKELTYVECPCDCSKHPSAGRGKCSECGHFYAPIVLDFKTTEIVSEDPTGANLN